MRLLADENFPRALVTRWRAEGHDVSWIRDVARGSGDAEVLARAQQEDRVLVTFDMDFGELAFRSRLPATCGILLFRIRASDPETLAERSASALATRKDWRGFFATISDHGVRVRPLPAAGNTGS